MGVLEVWSGEDGPRVLSRSIGLAVDIVADEKKRVLPGKQ